MKKKVLTLIDILHPSGAENMAVNIAVKLNDSEDYSPVVYATRRGGALEDRLRSANIPYMILGRKNIFEFYKFHRLKTLLQHEQIKLIHAHKMGSNFWGSIIGKLCNIPVISHYHAHDVKVKNRISQLSNKITGVLSSKIISVSDSEQQRLIKNDGVDPSKIITIHNGINYEKYHVAPYSDIKAQLGIPMSSQVVGIVAAIIEIKNHELFLRAACEVLKQNRKVKFLVVGDGDRRAGIEKLASELKIDDDVIFTGFRNDVADIISIIDVGVLTSHSEGIPVTLLEYMSSSKPVVCTDVGGVPELVMDNVNGFLVPPNDYQTLAKKINLLLTDNELAGKMGTRAYERVKENFSEQKMMEEIENLYDEILNNEE